MLTIEGRCSFLWKNINWNSSQVTFEWNEKLICTFTFQYNRHALEMFQINETLIFISKRTYSTDIQGVSLDSDTSTASLIDTRNDKLFKRSWTVSSRPIMVLSYQKGSSKDPLVYDETTIDHMLLLRLPWNSFESYYRILQRTIRNIPASASSCTNKTCASLKGITLGSQVDTNFSCIEGKENSSHSFS